MGYMPKKCFWKVGNDIRRTEKEAKCCCLYPMTSTILIQASIHMRDSCVDNRKKEEGKQEACNMVIVYTFFLIKSFQTVTILTKSADNMC